jgi:hypothetical protein
VGIVGALESFFIVAGTEREVSRLDSPLNFRVAFDAALFDQSGNGRKYQREHGERGDERDSSPRREVHFFEPLLQLAEFCEHQNHGSRVRGEQTDPRSGQTHSGIEPVAPGRRIGC